MNQNLGLGCQGLGTAGPECAELLISALLPMPWGSVATPVDREGLKVAYPPREQSQHQMQRILQSAAFRNAHTLQQLFQFLVTKAYGPDAEKLKEYTIGVEAFSRQTDFDPKTDPIVRVQTHRLRQKLKEYYDTDGRHDPILIEIPKGHYLPTFESANLGQAAALQMNAAASEAASSNGYYLETEGNQTHLVEVRSGGVFSRRGAIAVAAAIAIFTAGYWIGTKPLRFGADRGAASAGSGLSFDKSTDPVKAFWASLLGNDTSPIIAHADAVFLLDSHNDLFAFPHGASDYRGASVDPHLAQQFAADPSLVAKAGKLYYENVYLGSGDLDAVAVLANVFGQMEIKPVIEPGRDLTPDDLKKHNVILVGSSFQSYAVSQFNSAGDFTFVNPDPRLGDWRGMIVNSHPRPGEQAIYRTERDPVTGVLNVDYALITVQPGVVPGRYIVDLGGIDTTGCAGAAMFATSNTGMDELMNALAAQGIRGTEGSPPLFQALLSVRLEKGNEVLGTSLLAVHPLFHARKVSTPSNARKPSPSQETR
jgi:hypothetical protein